jgi:phosphoenolpyruvate-protein phosphotransferase (PTS system enzyme I)
LVEMSRLTGVGASEGVAVGPVFVHAGGEPEPERQMISEDAVEEELEEFRRAVELGVTELSMSAPSIPRAKKIISEL